MSERAARSEAKVRLTMTQRQIRDKQSPALPVYVVDLTRTSGIDWHPSLMRVNNTLTLAFVQLRLLRKVGSMRSGQLI